MYHRFPKITYAVSCSRYSAVSPRKPRNRLKEHMEYYLDIYIKELHRILRENGIKEIYSMESLKEDMKVVAPITIAISTMGFSLWLGLQDGDLVKSKNTCDSDLRNLALMRFKTKVIEMIDCVAQFGFITL